MQDPLKPLLVVLSASVLLSNAITANAQSAVSLSPVHVTGSRLPRMDAEGPLPATSITPEDIERSGQPGIAGLLRQQITNSFGSFTPTSGTGSAQGAAQINLRGVGAQRTLVLIDGRRLPNNPAFGGAAQNINNIPLDIIDHVEILRDGASAIYGSDAIGGVVNLVTRKNYTGIKVGTQFESPAGADGKAYTAAVSGGLSNPRGQLYFGLEYYDKDIIYSRDRPVLRDVTSAIGDPGTIHQYDMQGNIVPQNSNLDSSGNPRNFRPFDDCPVSGFATDPAHPHSNVVDGVCRYRVGAITGLTAALRRYSLSFGGQHRLNDVTRAFTQLLMTRARSFGRFAAAPVDTVISDIHSPNANGNIGIRIGPDNPNNPDPGSTLVLNYRPSVLGTRDNTVDDQVNQFLLGLRGRIDKGMFQDWEIAATFNDYRQHDSGRNYGLIDQLQEAVDAGSFNPFAPDAMAADAFRYRTVSNNRFSAAGLDGHVGAEWSQGHFILSSVMGFEYRRDEFSVANDAQSSQSLSFAADGSISGFQQSNVFGATGGSARGARSHTAAFMETSATMFERRLELGLALRLDEYSDVGGTLNPKFSLAYRPGKSLLLRGSYGRGFRAPDLASMHGAPTKSRALVIDRLSCRDNPDDVDACGSSERTAIYGSNPQLKSEKSRNLAIGAVWTPIAQAELSLDYYAIRISNAITQLTPQAVFDNERACADAARPCDALREGYVVRNSSDTLLFVYSPAINAAELRTRGIDLSARYRFPKSRHGDYSITAGLARTLSYQRRNDRDGPMLEHLDSLSASGEIFPRFRANAALDWTLGHLKATLRGNYISNVSDCDAPDKIAHRPACRNRFGDYFTMDAQLAIDTRWKQDIALGVRNLFNQAPRVSQYTRSIGVPGVFLALHDSDQRVLYLRITQRF
ncbi:MAG: TonB-dependent receptor [Rhizobium sp.]|nr:MAG: TonB-dependent receptor [Rhizobium sp.]